MFRLLLGLAMALPLLVTVITNVSASEGTAPNKQFDVETFTLPKAINLTQPDYPTLMLMSGREAWVEVSYMVDKDGNTYDINVTDTTAKASFVSAALDAVRQWRFEPALLGGNPIEAAMNHIVTFNLYERGATYTTERFVHWHNRFHKALEQNNQQRASAALLKMEKHRGTMFENLLMQVARFEYLNRYQEAPLQQYVALRRATRMNSGQGFLADESLNSLLAHRLQLEIQLNMVAQARSTANTLIKRLPETERAQFVRTVDEINLIETSGEKIVVGGEIEPGMQFNHQLLHTSFSIQNVTGGVVSELRLQCDKAGEALNTNLAPNIESILAGMSVDSLSSARQTPNSRLLKARRPDTPSCLDNLSTCPHHAHLNFALKTLHLKAGAHHAA